MVMAMPERIQLRRVRGWRQPPNTVRVDRRSLFGNPFVVGRDGNAERCVELFRFLMAGKVCLTQSTPQLQERCYRAVASAQRTGRLRGKNLGCWCRMGKPCHADVLLEIFNAPDQP